ncbi:MAG: hypothetical protein ACE5KZ_06595 [Candidatus Scalinduaceae bacterium]
MTLDKINAVINNIEKLKMIIRDPEQFLINKYYNLGAPNGFRIELLTARKYNLICDKLKQFHFAHFETTDSWLEKEKMINMIPVKRIREVVASHSLAKKPKKLFCPYCEKSVIPKRLHKLDLVDIVLFLITGGIWAILLFTIYIFIRRCPVCNYNMRGFKPLSENKKIIDN